MLCGLASYKGQLYHNTGDFTEGAAKNTAGLESLFIIYTLDITCCHSNTINNNCWCRRHSQIVVYNVCPQYVWMIGYLV